MLVLVLLVPLVLVMPVMLVPRSMGCSRTGLVPRCRLDLVDAHPFAKAHGLYVSQDGGRESLQFTGRHTSKGKTERLMESGNGVYI